MDYSNTGSGNIFSRFMSNNYVNSTSEFLSSNSLVAKVAFLLLVLLVFIILLRMGVSLLTWLFSTSRTPKLLNGMVDARQSIVISQNPNSPNSITIPRSFNQDRGIEFTWSCWIFIDDLTYNSGKYRCVFYKGGDTPMSQNPNSDKGLNFPNNAPGLYISPDTNALDVFMDTFTVINEKVTVPNIPLNKWLNIILICQNRILDIYINGTIAKSHKLSGVPKQNFGDVYIAPNGGFAGYISNLWYYDYALTPIEISNIALRGPTTTLVKNPSQSADVKDSRYLSLRWFFFGTDNAYNP